MSFEDSKRICGLDLTTTSVILASLLIVTGFIQIIVYSGRFLPSIGLFCSYGGCSFQANNLEEIFGVYSIIEAIFYFVFGMIFLAGIIKRDTRLVSLFVYFTWLNMIMTLIFLIVSHVKLSNYLSLSYIYTVDTLILFWQGAFAYVGMHFRKSIRRPQSTTEYLRLSNLCLLP